MANPLRKFEKLPPWQGPPAPEPPHRDWPVPSSQYRHTRRAPIDTFVIHGTAGGSSSGAMSVPQSGAGASWHWLVPDEDEKGHGEFVYRCVPDSGSAWHVLAKIAHPVPGASTINDRSFGVEVVNWQDGRDKFSDWQLRMVAQMVRYTWSRYGVKHLFTHSYLDPTRRDDPTTIFNWDLFMDYVMDGAEAHERPALTVTVDGTKADIGAWVDKGISYAHLRRTVGAMGGSIGYDGPSNTIAIRTVAP